MTALSFKKNPNDTPPLKLGDNFKTKGLHKMSNYDTDQLTDARKSTNKTPSLKQAESKVNFANEYQQQDPQNALTIEVQDQSKDDNEVYATTAGHSKQISHAVQ